MSSSLGTILVDMATEVFGEPTFRSSNIIRFKKSKGVAVNVTDGTWFDFTEAQGGGVTDFITQYFPDRKKAEVFKQFGGVDFLLGLTVGIHLHIDI
tara:strand:- start:269 stop:556 length:288 start_codon:yes stop_codon:yes gene_type:complete